MRALVTIVRKLLLMFFAVSLCGQAWAQAAPSGNEGRNRARIHTELGSAYFQAGNPAAALDHLTIAIQSDSGYVRAYSVRGVVYTSLKEYAKAEDDFRRALDREPADPEVNNNYGWFLCETGKAAQSIQYFLKAVKDPLYETPGRAYANAGSCAMRAEQLDAAQQYLLKSIEVSRDGAPVARLHLAQLFYRRGIYEEARIYLKDVLRTMDSPTAEALWLGIRIERKLGDRETESTYAAQLRSRHPTSVEYQAFLRGDFQ